MPIVKFKADYDHTWPSRAVTAFKRGWSGPVKQEVATAAKKAGALYKDGEGGTVETEPTLPGNLPPSLATPAALTPNLSTAPETE